MPAADADAVRVELDTDLDDADIEDVLARASRDVDREYSADDFADTAHRRDFEAVLAAFRIASGRDRRLQKQSLGDASQTFEASEVAYLRSQVRKLDPGTEFSTGGVTRDTDRTVRAAEINKEDD